MQCFYLYMIKSWWYRRNPLREWQHLQRIEESLWYAPCVHADDTHCNCCQWQHRK